MRYRAVCAVFLIAAGLLSVLAGPGMAELLLAQNQVISAVETAINLPHRLSPFTMFAAADWVVKAVIIGLLLLSALSWVIFIVKSLELALLRRQAQAVLKAVAQAPNLGSTVSAAAGQKGAALLLVLAAAAEMETSQKAVAEAGNAGLKERVASVLAAIQLKARRGAAKNIGIIATIGSVAPFIGLFGTVWGIMNAFIGIAESQTTGLSAVAPGIAEALLATAIGLFAAIPATIIYNIFVRSITVYRHILADISAAIERLVSRDLDFSAARITAENISASGR